MKTFKQYLTEAEVPDLMKVLNKDCELFMKVATNNGLLLRGIKDIGTDKKLVTLPWDKHEGAISIWKKDVRQDRNPSATRREDHNMVDNWFYRTFGFKARSQAVFCLGKKAKDSTIDIYGDPYIIFPIGKFEYVWSPYVDDLFSEMTLNMKHIKTQDEINWFLEDKGYTSTNIEKALRGRSEIMIKCSSYYAIERVYEHGIREAMGIK